MTTKKIFFLLVFSTEIISNEHHYHYRPTCYTFRSNLLCLQNRASATMISPPEYDVAPIAAPALPHPVRPRRRARRQNNNPSTLNHPQNLQPRGI